MQMGVDLHFVNDIGCGYQGVDVIESCLESASAFGDKGIVNLQVEVDLVVVTG